jgi:hypothetical protein
MDLEPRMIVSSHAGIIRDNIQQRLSRYEDVIDARSGAILELIRKQPRTLAEMVAHSPIYNGHRHAPPLQRYWEGQMIQKHLDLLQADDRVRRRDDEVYTAPAVRRPP